MATVKTGEFKISPPQPERREEVTKTICDMCQKDMPQTDLYYVEDVEVSLEVGTSYPGSHNTDTKRYDICRSCFENKLVPFIENRGFVVSEDDIIHLEKFAEYVSQESFDNYVSDSHWQSDEMKGKIQEAQAVLWNIRNPPPAK